MDENAPGRLLLAAQRALVGNITPNLRSFSVEKDGRTLRTLAVFAEDPTVDEIELMQCVGTEIIADFVDALITEDVVVSVARPTRQLRHVAYERWDSEG